MGIVAAIFMFVIGAVFAACDGDFSGLEAIGKFILYVGLFFLFAWMILNPAVLVIFIIIVVLALFAVMQK